MDRADPLQQAFDDVVIDFAGHRVWRSGTEQALEPKAFAVLALLAKAPGTVFTREEILDKVWGHRHVTPGVLNRVMTMLRHALGEDAHSARYLHTLHGVGYRFDLPASAGVTTAEVARSAPDDTTGVPEPVDAPLTPPVDRQRRTTDPEARRTMRRMASWALPLAGLLLLLGWQLWPPPSSTVRSAVSVGSAKPPTLVVLPLKPIGDGDGVRIIADGLSEELISSLARIEGLGVIARESTRLAASETSDPAQLAQRLGITHSLEGSLQQAGQTLRIRLRLLDTRGGALWTKNFDRDASEVLQLQRDVAEAVATSLALKLGLAIDVQRSGDAEFLRRFLAAKASAGRADLPARESTEVAENAFRALLRERPDDARVRASLALAIHRRIQREPTHAAVSMLRAEALHEAGIAMRLDPSLPEPYVVKGTAACQANDWERCVDLREHARARGAVQDNVSGYAFTLAQLGYLDRAQAMLREQIAHDPINAQPHFLFGRMLDTLGDHERAHRQFEAHRTPNDVYGRWFNAVWRGDLAHALRIAEEEMGLPGSPDGHGVLLKPGYVATAQALLDPARWPQAVAANDAFERETGLMQLCRVLSPDAPVHVAALISKLDDARQRGYSSWDLLLWTKELAFLRRDPAFQVYLKETGILAYWRKHGFPRQCRPQGDGAYCD